MKPNENLDFDEITVKDNGNGRMFIWCPACSATHIIDTMAFGQRGNCNFDGNYYKPTFKLESGMPYLVTQSPYGICCFTIINGIISYLSYSSHLFAGHSVDMRPRKEWGGISFYRNEITRGFDHEIKD